MTPRPDQDPRTIREIAGYSTIMVAALGDCLVSDVEAYESGCRGIAYAYRLDRAYAALAVSARLMQRRSVAG